MVCQNGRGPAREFADWGPQVELPVGHDPCEEYAEKEEAEKDGDEAEEKGKREGGGGGGARGVAH